MKKEIKNVTILEKTVRSENGKILKQVQDDMLIKNDGVGKTVRLDKAQMLKRVQHDMEVVQDDMGWFRCGFFGALAPEKVFSLFTYHLSRKSAFTLSEVLITLGIIGVVAAMTLPTLIAKYEHKARVVKWRKTYSLLTNAMTMLQATDNDIATAPAGVPEENKYRADIFAKYLKTYKVCDKGKAKEQGCRPDDDKVYYYDSPRNTNFSDIGGGCADIRLVDGTDICIDGDLLYVDINGGKKPNRYGYDIFVANADYSQYKILPADGSTSGYGCVNSSRHARTTGDGTCQAADNGCGCSAYYLLNDK